MESRKFWIVIILLVVIGLLVYGFFVFTAENDIKNNTILFFGAIGGLLLLINIFGYNYIREYFFFIFHNEYINDQYDLFTYFAGIEKNQDLVHYYNENNNTRHIYFKEAIYAAADIESNFDMKKALAYSEVFRKLLDQRFVMSVSNEVIRLMYIKILLMINEQEYDEDREIIIENNIYRIRKCKSKYYEIFKENDNYLKDKI